VTGAGTALSGPTLFARYAYPPNALGYCGPPDSEAVRAYGVAGTADPAVARTFDGAWPYLRLIAARAGIGDPLDRRVVEAYWVGNRLLDATGVGLDGGVAHHSFHVFCRYPWAAMLPDPRGTGHALTVLDRCRIGWGRVTALPGDDRVDVRTRPLTWNGRRLGLGAPVIRTARTPGVALAVGDRVSLHWDWVCDRLSERRTRALRAYTRRHLDLASLRIGQNCPMAPVGVDISAG
jgi:hypothetical protein